MKITLVLGTRPEIIKCSPIIRACLKQGIKISIVHSNQHYSSELDEIFFKELELPIPAYNLNVGSGTHAYQTAAILTGLEPILLAERPTIVLVQGDTNTVLGGALTASKLNIPVGHIEAGLRSHFWAMPEEKNRILTDHMSDQLYAPSSNSVGNLRKEGIEEKKIFMVGNTVVDAVFQNKAIAAQQSQILSELNLKKDQFLLLTAHRAENIDQWDRFQGILDGATSVAKNVGMPVIFPIHPRAKKILNQSSYALDENIKLIDPVGYFDFLQLQEYSRLVLTDSGGVQEECCILQTPCVTLRDNTERPETITAGGNIIAGTSALKIQNAAEVMLSKERSWSNPFGDGTAAEKILDCIVQL